PPEAQRRADEVLQGEQHQPGVVVPAAPGPVPDLYRPLLHAAELREASTARRPVVAALRAEHRRARNEPLVRVRAAGRLRRQPARVDVLHVRLDAAVSADHHVRPSVRVHLRDRALSGRSRPLLDDDQPLDGRPGADHAPPDSEGGTSRAGPETLIAHAAEGGGRADAGRRTRAEAEQRTAPREAKEEGATLMELQVEATGETVGEAKWSALRELERQRPGLDKSAVRFQVVSEGERGLLGVGFTPARVIATVAADAVPPAAPAVVRDDESDLATEARELVQRIV